MANYSQPVKSEKDQTQEGLTLRGRLSRRPLSPYVRRLTILPMAAPRTLHLIGDRFVRAPSCPVFTFSFGARLRAFLGVPEPLSSEHEALHSFSPFWVPRLIFYSHGHLELQKEQQSCRCHQARVGYLTSLSIALPRTVTAARFSASMSYWS
jgi:hypothetical protein